MVKNIVEISDLDAAKRQLEFAIKMFFNSLDIVVIHTLVCASQEVLEKMGKRMGIPSLNQKLKESIKPEKRKEVMEKIRKPQNFFKHGGIRGSISFYPESSEYIMFDAVTLYHNITSEISPLMMAFKLWFFLKNSELLGDESFKKIVDSIKDDPTYRNRAFFLEYTKEIDRKMINS